MFAQQIVWISTHAGIFKMFQRIGKWFIGWFKKTTKVEVKHAYLKKDKVYEPEGISKKMLICFLLLSPFVYLEYIGENFPQLLITPIILYMMLIMIRILYVEHKYGYRSADVKYDKIGVKTLKEIENG